MERNISCEEMIEELKREFPTVKFLPGSVGFVVRRRDTQYVLSYDIFDSPRFMDIMINIVTLLEVGDV